MELRPINDTSTLTIINENKVPAHKYIHTPPKTEVIVSKERMRESIATQVAKNEVRLRLFVVIIALLLIGACGGYTIWLTLGGSTSWVNYVIPGIITLIACWRLIPAFFDYRAAKSALKRWQEDVNTGLQNTPIVIGRIYRKLQLQQIGHNWLMVFILLYGGLFTLLLWWLRDVSWWVFDFHLWITSLFESTSAMVWIMASLLIMASALYLWITIERRRQITEIETSFDSGIIAISSIDLAKQGKNEMCFKIFKLSLIVFLIVPFLLYYIVKLIRR